MSASLKILSHLPSTTQVKYSGETVAHIWYTCVCHLLEVKFPDTECTLKDLSE